MVWIVIVGVLLILFILVFLVFPITVQISYRYPVAEIHSLKMIVRIGRIPIVTRDLPTPNWFDISGKSSVSIKDIRPFFKRITIEQLEWETGIGVGEANVTGMVAGLFWTSKDMLVHWLHQNGVLGNVPRIMVKPNYHGEGFYTRFDCELVLRVRDMFKFRTLRKKFNH